MKILLVQPPWAEIYGKYKPAAKAGVLYPPLGLCYLAPGIEKAGHQVKIIDMEAQGVDLASLLTTAETYRPDLVGITSTTPLFYQAKRIARKIKERINIPLVIGGPHIAVMPDEAMKDCDSFDYGIYGEGEKAFSELVNALASKKRIEGIAGLLYRENGTVVKTGPRPFEPDLDSLSFPNRGLLQLDRYLWGVPGKGIVRFTTILTSRGCPFQCIFCSQRTVFGTKVRYRHPENILNEIEHIVNDLGIKHFAFLDETLTMDRKHVEDICQGIIDRKIEVTWEGWTRANTVDEELLRLMKRAGFVRISFGIESGDPEILKVIKKGEQLSDFITGYKIAKKVGLETRASLMLGHPYETKKSALKSLRFVKNIKECDQLYLNISTPYPGTEFYEMAKRGEGGIRLLTDDFAEYRRYGNPVIEVTDLTKKDLIKLQKRGFLSFYLTPGRVYYNLKRAGIKAGIKNAFAFVRSIRR